MIVKSGLENFILKSYKTAPSNSESPDAKKSTKDGFDFASLEI